ncbi:aspartate--tRNA ligase [Fimbriimonas ginsengisoli]|uniref:Aspartate--tRNA(Asp/Asn) ligase n=1 Tax=Fimbriimonas ginsengisoli Gsoil 348 TaxID=661478 RepID=A0A068NTQ4_FIMGI|nr:aspartate--tRNA ligase [Fimbriimonas ginsengisoli]AIE86742.1 aspartyl-tRNA synthetase [Fimbriimonas ginsengisoli Gsoil 348]
MGFVQRTKTCGELRAAHAGEQVSLNGWAHRVRDLGGVLFVDLRDRTGLVQLTLDPNLFPNRNEIRSESCLSVTGEVRERAEGTKNPRMSTGDIEVIVTSYSILGPAKPLPFPVSDEDQMQSVNEELRVKHRYLDLRRPSMYRRLALRAAAMRMSRAYLDKEGFLEIETPIITKSTPEGARDYLVPFRNEPGKWYALPQSPQQYKQLLMVSGVERYYQMARCFRDESSRADRQPEFTQIDLEMSFIRQEDVLQVAEGMTRSVINGLIEEFELDKEPVGAFDRITYDEAMHLYGCDKPDMRFGLQLFDATELFRDTEFAVFKNVIESGGFIRGVRYPAGAKLSRKEVGALEEFAKEFGAKGLGTVMVEETLRGSLAKFVTPEMAVELRKLTRAEDGDLLLFVADEYAATNNVLYRLRLEIGDRLGLRDPRILKYIWVLDFPLVEWDADGNRWSSMHHPFTMPREEDLVHLETDPARIRAEAYDMVCNGTEAAGGSIRIHRSDIQARIFSMLGIDERTQQDRFGHILEAFSFGAPPHGGIAWGFDRFAMLLTDTENIREVMAFPKVANGYDPLMDAPSTVDAQQWAELGLRLS